MQNLVYFFAHIEDYCKAVSYFIGKVMFFNTINDDFFENNDQVDKFFLNKSVVFLRYDTYLSYHLIFLPMVVHLFQIEFQNISRPLSNVMIVQKQSNYI